MEKIFKLLLLFLLDRDKFKRVMEENLLNSIFIVFGIIAILIIIFSGKEIYSQVKFANSYFNGEQNPGMVVLDETKVEEGTEIYLRNCKGLNFDKEDMNPEKTLTPFKYDLDTYLIEYVWTFPDGSTKKTGREEPTKVKPYYINTYQSDVFGLVGRYFTIPKDTKLKLSCKNSDYKTLQTMTFDHTGTSMKIENDYLIEITPATTFWEVIDFFVYFLALIIIILYIYYIKKGQDIE